MMFADVPSCLCGTLAHGWREYGELKLQKLAVVLFVHGIHTVSVFVSDAKCSPVCKAHTCAYSVL